MAATFTSRPSPIWAALACTGLFTLALGAIMLAPYATPPAPGRVTGVLFSASAAAANPLGAILTADAGAQIIGLRLHGRLIFVVYHQADFPARIARLGALRSFDAVAAGCHGAGPATPLAQLPP